MNWPIIAYFCCLALTFIALIVFYFYCKNKVSKKNIKKKENITYKLSQEEYEKFTKIQKELDSLGIAD